MALVIPPRLTDKVAGNTRGVSGRKDGAGQSLEKTTNSPERGQGPTRTQDRSGQRLISKRTGRTAWDRRGGARAGQQWKAAPEGLERRDGMSSSRAAGTPRGSKVPSRPGSPQLSAPPHAELAASGAGAQLPSKCQVSRPHRTTPHTDAISLGSGVSVPRSPGAQEPRSRPLPSELSAG